MNSSDYSAIYHQAYMIAEAYQMGRTVMGDLEVPTGKAFSETFAELYAKSYPMVPSVHPIYLQWQLMQTMNSSTDPDLFVLTDCQKEN